MRLTILFIPLTSNKNEVKNAIKNSDAKQADFNKASILL
ncbi:hypothetical protein FM109_05690 [Vibrio casei]|nr:hypothetical protein FM109_05690 [Vibrio casei]